MQVYAGSVRQCAVMHLEHMHSDAPLPSAAAAGAEAADVAAAAAAGSEVGTATAAATAAVPAVIAAPTTTATTTTSSTAASELLSPKSRPNGLRARFTFCKHPEFIQARFVREMK